MSGRKKREQLINTYYKIKNEAFDFGKIERYFSASKKENVWQIISDRTYQDLDMEDVFRFIDRTTSRVGQQYLYNLMRTLPSNNERTERLEILISLFKENSGLKESVLHEISGLNNKDAYYITSLFLEPHIPKPRWFPAIQVLSLISVCSVLLSFIFPQLLIFLIFLFPVNLGIHYWNKMNLLRYSTSIPQLLRLNQIAGRISKNNDLNINHESLDSAIETLNSQGLFMSLFRLEAKLQSEAALFIEYLLELIKALFLIEPIVLFRILKVLDSKRQNIAEVYDFIGELDAAISITSLRDGLPGYCSPTLTADKKQMDISEAYHPLIYNAVSNSIKLDKKSALLTGSNMSGKTTFIRTIGINVILAQTINTCFAEKFVMARMKIHSGIRIADDLLSEKSYYFEEVLTIKSLLEESTSGTENLFLLDEIFKGTNTVERIAAGKSVLSYLNKGNNLVFVSTHDPELAYYLKETYDLYHFAEIIEDHTILFDYKIKPGNLITTNAIRILELNDYPREVIVEAIQLSGQIKKTSATKI